ncbi:hypothetical protein TNCV_283991 [Trichonephila clavipes]|uniref:Uncharacterized protein n=1 Tax=Trichonephila clavipes TaxID=2585209 RepID=A0A8X6SFH1_TRICX|nr:hypothetical protein TNCV_283991 [Trichonephila clavipes]
MPKTKINEEEKRRDFQRAVFVGETSIEISSELPNSVINSIKKTYKELRDQNLPRKNVFTRKLRTGRFLLSRKEVILLRVVEEPALGSRGLTRRTFSLGGGEMVKKETAAGVKKRPVRS